MSPPRPYLLRLLPPLHREARIHNNNQSFFHSDTYKYAFNDIWMDSTGGLSKDARTSTKKNHTPSLS